MKNSFFYKLSKNQSLSSASVAVGYKHGKTKCARFQKRKAYFPTKNEMRFEKHFISIKKASEHKFQMPFFFSITSDIQVEFDIL